MDNATTFAVLVALDEEASYFRDIVTCGDACALPNGGAYWPILDVEWACFGNGILISAGKMGRSEARKATSAAISHFNVPLIVNIGIAGRVDAKRKIGDVVVPSICLDVTDGSKVTGPPDAVQWQHSPRQFDISGPLIRIAQTHLKAGSPYAAILNGGLLNRFRNRELLSEKGVSVVSQPLVCVPNVGATEPYRASLALLDRTIAAMDMESAGVIEEAKQHEREVLCIRGVSDHAGNDKALQEGLYKDENRRLAMEAAIRVLFLVFTRHIDEHSDKAPTGVFRINSNTRDLREDYLVYEKQEPLFSLLVRGADGRSIEQPLVTIANAVVAASSKSVVAVIGDKGSGKTALFRSLQWLLSNEGASRLVGSAGTPILIRLSELEKWSDYHFDKEGTQLRTRRVLEHVLRVADETTDLILLLDGLNPTGHIREGIAADLLKNIRLTGSVRVALSAESIEDIERLEIEVPELSVNSYFFLEPLDIEDPQLPTLVERFRDQRLTRYGLAKNSVESQVVLDQMRQMNVQSVDVYLLQLFFDLAADIRDRRMRTLSQVYEIICERAMAIEGHRSPERRRSEIQRVAAVAFGILISGEAQVTAIREQNIARLISTHSSVSYFLVATHLISRLLAAESASDVSDWTSLMDYVFPSEVNNHTKQMMQTRPDVEDSIVKFIHKWHNSLNGLPKSHLAYLAGRVSNDHARDMLSVLRQMGLPFAKRSPLINRDQRMLRRTIFISRTLLGDAAAEEEYVDLLLTDREEAEFNRGFHLVYWGDKAFEATGKMSNRDDGTGGCNRTFARLQARISRSKNSVRQIELLTLLSLAQVRYVRGSLRDEHRLAVLHLISGDRVSDQPFPPRVRGYIDRLKEDFENGPYNPATVLDEWNDLVATERTGWLRRRRDADGSKTAFWTTCRIESVAEHTFGAIALAEAFLETKSDGPEQYDKARVIDLLRIHDLAESRLGDLINGQANPKTELAVLWKYGAFETYPNIGNLWSVPERFQEFNDGQTPNSRIAQDLDRLQFVLQARRMRDGMSERESIDCEKALGKLATKTVQSIAKLLHKAPVSCRYSRPSPKY